jgi:hypothetical protein
MTTAPASLSWAIAGCRWDPREPSDAVVEMTDRAARLVVAESG